MSKVVGIKIDYNGIKIDFYPGAKGFYIALERTFSIQAPNLMLFEEPHDHD